MYRKILMIVVAVVAVDTTPVDAQLFRRFAQQRQAANYGQMQRQAYQQPTAQPQQDGTCQAQQQLLAQQQAKLNQGVSRIPSTYSNQPSAAQQTSAQQAAAQQKSGQQTVAQRTTAEQRASAGSATEGQRFAVFYNPRTRQTILRPIQALTNRNQNSVAQRNLSRQTVAQPAVPPRNIVAPAATGNQVDIARQRSSVGIQQPVSNLTLNAPQVTSPTKLQTAPETAPAIASPTGTVTSSPTESPEPKQAFSILDSGGPDDGDDK